MIVPFDVEPGAGFRGSFEIVDNGFIPSLNNTVAIGFGIDVTGKHLRVPAALQWNFWLTKRWSVFVEPGAVLPEAKKKFKPKPSVAVGGRFHFSDTFALTLRAGHQDSSVGLSFLL